MHSAILNIIVQIIEGLITFDFYENIKSSQKKLKKCLIISGCYIIMCIINLVFNYNVVINTIVLITFQFIFSHVLYSFKILFSLLYSILFTSLVTITELSSLQLVSVIASEAPRDIYDNIYSYIILIVLSKSLLFIVLKFLSLTINKFHFHEKVRFTILMYPISLLLILTDFVIVANDKDLSNNIRLLLAISSLFLITAVVSTCILQQKEAQKEEELIELKAFQQEQELNTTYFELLEHQNEELQVFVHDTKNHYRNIYGLTSNPEKIKEYIENIVSDIEETNQIGKTSNKLLDLIISKYNYVCDKKEITFEKNIHQSNLSFINDNDLTSIFNNLFDNAVEAATNSRNKTISFGLNKVGNMLVIDVTNSCDTPPIVKNHKLISTKKDSILHGYGFKSICRAVKKYNGDIEWEYKPETKEFVVSIIFPVHSNSI